MLVPAAVAGISIRPGGVVRVGRVGVVTFAEIHLERGGKEGENAQERKNLKPAINKPRQLEQLESVPAAEHWDYSLNQRALFVSMLTPISQSEDCSTPNGVASLIPV